MAAARKQGPSPSRLEARLCDLGRGGLSSGCMALALVADVNGRPQPALLAVIVCAGPSLPRLGPHSRPVSGQAVRGLAGKGSPLLRVSCGCLSLRDMTPQLLIHRPESKVQAVAVGRDVTGCSREAPDS